MLWEYVYIGSDLIRNSIMGLCLMVGLSLTSSTNKSQGNTRLDVAERVRSFRRQRNTKSGSSKKNNKHMASIALEESKGLGTLFALEPRIMFDGAAFVTGAEVIQDQSTQDIDLQSVDVDIGPQPYSDPFTHSIDLLSALSSPTVPSDRKEIVFIDTSVEGYETLLLGINPSAEAILLDATRDGMEQIAEILGQRSNIDGVHIISHGDSGELRLGTGGLNLASMQGKYANELAVINQALTDEADFLIYGCNFGEGESGQEAATLLAKLTGTDVAASVDDTGSAQYEANWDLEYQTGIIETQVAVSAEAQKNWVGKLAIITVDTFADVVNGGDGVTSLREAIIAANAGAGGDTINLAAGTYTMSIAGTGENAATTGDLDILKDVTISGAGAGSTIINAGGIDRVFETRSSTIATISGVTIQGGNSSGGGGINIANGTDLTLSNVIVSGNTSTTTGGGISNTGILSLIDTAISGNSAVWGGGINNDNSTSLTLERVTIDANTSSNNGGGIYNFGGTSVALTNVTISGNTSAGNGGGIWTNQSINITNSTIASNLGGGGIHGQGGPGDVVLKNTILDNNTGGNANKALTSLGNNIDSGNTAGLAGTGDQTNTDPMLAALANNGGTTQTHALLGGSPAINTGTATGAPAVDQRGVTRDASVDIGAYEVAAGNTAPTADAGGPYSINEGENLTLNANGSSDPDLDLLTYKWDLDNDSIFGEPGEPTTVGPTVSWATLQSFGIDDDGVYTIGVEAEDGNGGSDTATTTLTVNNLAPTLTTTGAATTAGGSSYTLNLSASDPGNDTITGWTINWGDGTIDTVAGNPPSVTHTYTNSGLTFNILASATDEDGTFLQNELLVPRYTADSIFRFEETTGAFLQQFAPQSEGLDDPLQTIIGPDGNLYVTGERSDNVVRYNPTTGTRIGVEFVTANSGGLNSPGGLTFGPDGNLYVASYDTHEVLRYDGTTGAFINVFATGVTRAYGVTFGPDGNLYVNSFTGNTVLKFDGTTGASLGTFVTANDGGLDTPERMIFGPDGHLYIASAGSDEVLRYNGTDGTFINAFVSTATPGGLASPSGIAFGPDGNLYVGSETNDNVLRYDGTTGAFLGEYVSAATGLDRPSMFTFLPVQQVLVTNAVPTLDLDANDSSGATGNDYQFTFTEGDSATAIADSDTDLVDPDSTTFASVKLAVSGLLDGNVETLVLDSSTFGLATAVAQNTAGGTYHVAITTGAGTANIVITKPGAGTFSEAETETLIEAIQYQHTNTSTPTDGNRLIDVTVNDGILDSAAARTTINVNPANDQPSFAGLDNTPTFIEGGTAVVLDNNATISDPELDATNNYSGATLRLARNGGPNGNDVFNGSGSLNPLVQSGSLVVNTTTIGTVTTNSAGTLVLTFNGNATTTLVNSTLQQITYQNTNGNPPANVQIDFTINDGNVGAQGSSGALNGTGSVTVIILPPNTAPTVDLDANNSSGTTGNNYSFSFTEGDAATAIADNDTDLVDVDSTTFTSVTLAVSGLLDGNAETLVLDSSTFGLATAVGQNTAGGTYHVAIATGAGTANIVITKPGAGTFSEAETETLIEAIQYQHTDTSTPADGNRLIDVTVNDGILDSAAARTTINVNPANDPPIAFADGFTVIEGSTTPLDLAGNDTDPDDGLDLTSITILSGPTNGTINSINADGTVTYTHNGTETLTDSFTYTIDDLAGVTSNTVTVSLTVTPANDPPVAAPDSFTVNESSTNTLNLAGNDTDVDDGLDLTSITIISGPTNGTITSINTNGTVEYTHNGSETLTDSFTYTIHDVAGATSNTATVSLIVTPQNDAPLITSDGGGASASVPILTGNTAVTDVNAFDAEGSPVTYGITGGADAALFTIDPATGVLTFRTTPNVQTPTDVGGDNIYDVIVQASDGTLIDTQAIAITVSDVPAVVLPPTVDSPSEPPSESGEEDAGESEDFVAGNVLLAGSNAHGHGSSGNQSSTGDDPQNSSLLNHQVKDNVALLQQLKESHGINGGAVGDLLDLLQTSIGTTTLKSEIASLLGTSSGFLKDLDEARDTLDDMVATEKTYVASSIAASTGLSVGYVFWLLRSGVLLTALLSSVPAWQFVNPLLVLDTPTKKKHLKGQEDLEDDSVESMFENDTTPHETPKTQSKNTPESSLPT